MDERVKPDNFKFAYRLRVLSNEWVIKDVSIKEQTFV